MKLQFDSTLPYQQSAIDAVVNLFAGQSVAQSQFEVSNTTGNGIALSEYGIRNNITLKDERLLKNVHKIQKSNKIRKIGQLQGREFSIEMETGTGKTYVYLRTIFELSRQYGLKKFIIVVPSIAIREGVMKSIEMTKDHFRTLYNKPPFTSFTYDSKKLSEIHKFAIGNELQIMVINIQSFSKDIKDENELTESSARKINIMNRENDKLSGYKPIDYVSSTKPIVIIDEPQSVDNTQKAKRAIQKLNPSVTLRYSATHKNAYNLLYKLDPIDAYNLRLVKRIEVASVLTQDTFTDAYVKLLKVDNSKGIRAQVEIHKATNSNVKAAKVWVKQYADLYEKSGKRECYKDGYKIQTIDCTPNGEYIELTNNRDISLGASIGGLDDDIMKAQVRETIEQHLKKELRFKSKGIKVLSLFFIDKVANYRTYNDDGTVGLGKIGMWFEEAYLELSQKPRYKNFVGTDDVKQIHDGYFSMDKKGRAQDTGETDKSNNNTYNLIMRDKEKLLDPKEPLRFIFSHSALREGWDNPNVFQICTLNETGSTDKKRQEIGRGLRLPVNQNGERVHDKDINQLTVIANESYENFARALQTEFKEDCGIRFGIVSKIAFSKIIREQKAIGKKKSKRIFKALVVAGYIGKDGEILDKFDPTTENFQLAIDEKYNDINSDIIDILNRHILKNHISDSRKRRTLSFQKEVFVSAEFKDLWDQIKHRTRYRVAFKTDALINKAVNRIAKLPTIDPATVYTTKGEMNISKAGVDVGRHLDNTIGDQINISNLPDLLTHLQKETELTRHTLVKILEDSNRLNEFQGNPHKFMTLLAREISYALKNLIKKGIKYEKISDCWAMSRIEEEAEQEITHYLNHLYEVRNKEKCLFDAVKYESNIEKEFAQRLDDNQNVRLFVKLPHWFKIDTPVGSYNPDWALVTERDEKLYFVCETKSTTDIENLRSIERAKIKYGRRHFKAINTDYRVVQKLSDINF